MTPFEDGLIKALEHIGNTDWKGNIFNLIGILIASGFSAWAAFMIAKNQTEKQIAEMLAANPKLVETRKPLADGTIEVEISEAVDFTM